jgi:hypothetical protein
MWRGWNLRARNSDAFARLNGREASGVAIYGAPGSNALATASAVVEGHIIADRLGAHAAHSGLHVLRLDGGGNVRRGQSQRGQPVRLEPDPHGVVLQTKQCDLAHPPHTGERVDEVDRGVVVQKQRVEGAVGRVERDHLEQRGGLLSGAQPQPLHFLRQGWDGEGHAVLRVDRGNVRVGPHFEADVEAEGAIIAACGAHVDHVLHAVHLAFHRLGDGLFDHKCAGAGVGARNRHLWRDNVGKLLDGQRALRNQPGNRNDQ